MNRGDKALNFADKLGMVKKRETQEVQFELPYRAHSYFVDVFLGLIVILSIISLFESLSNVSVYELMAKRMHEPLLFAAIVNGAAWLVYYFAFSNKVKWRSPGELAAGRVFDGEKKIYVNKYGINRAGFYILNVISLIVLLNIYLGNSLLFIYDSKDVIGKLIVVAAYFIGTALIGQGKLHGFYIMICGAALGAVQSLFIVKYFPKEILLFGGYIGIIVVSTVVYIGYKIKLNSCV